MFLIIIILIYAAIVIWFTIGWLHLKHKIDGQFQGQVTLIIPCRNEAGTISRLLQCIDQQQFNFKNLTVLVVNDHSTDLTVERITDFKGQNVNPIILNLTRSEKGKKAAIDKAISYSTSELIVCTDADCMPGPQWLNSVCAQFLIPSTQMVCGPVQFIAKPGFWNGMMQLDFISLIAIGASTLSQKFPTMCNGANLAYRKSAFLAVDGFAGNAHLPSGDDEFLMHKFFKTFKNGVVFLKDKEAIVDTNAPVSFSEFVHQRLRWGSKASHYKGVKHKLLPVYMFGVNLMMLCSPFFLLLGLPLPTFIFLWVTKFFAELLFFSVILPFFNKVKLLTWLLPAQIFHVLYIVGVGLLSLKGKYKWKGR